MNQVFAGTAALIMALLLWGLGKKPRIGLNNQTDPKSIGRRNNPELSLIEKRRFEPPTQKPYISKFSPPCFTPQTIQERIILRKQLCQLMSGGPTERLEAIRLADQLKDNSILPILRKGLKDSNSYVVLAASNALEKYRGPVRKIAQEVKTLRPPLNVSLTR